MTNVTILTDDNGVKREYREVERKANVGDRVLIVSPCSTGGMYTKGDVLTVDRYGHIGLPITNVGVTVFKEEYLVLDPTDIIHVDGVRYREEKREAKVGERILIVAAEDAEGLYANGSVQTVREVSEVFGCVLVNGHAQIIFHREYVVITPLYEEITEPNEPTPNNITVNLTVNVASSSPSEILKAIVDSVQAELARFVGEPNDEETRDKMAEALTNKFRDGVVEQAKADVKGLALDDKWNVDRRRVSGKEGPFYLFKRVYGTYADFIINRKKRTVVCLLRGYEGHSVLAKGIAKCSPDDCFNVHIGKAIALRRALGLDVPTDYLNAPQPAEARVGDVVVIAGKQSFHHYYDVGDIGHVKDISNSVGELKVYGKRTADADRSKDGYYQHVSVTDVEIIDDSRDQETEVTAVA